MYFSFLVLNHDGRVIKAEMSSFLNAAQGVPNFSGFIGIVKGYHNQVRHFIPPLE
jgi:hypothetical protein